MRRIICFLYLVLFASIHSISTISYSCDTSSVCGCSTVSTVVTTKIVGGEAAPDHAWGWIVSLQLNDVHRCGASLLTYEYAVTAAHCVDDVLNNPSALSILAGTNYLNSTSSTNSQRRTIAKIYIHPNFDPVTIVNDVAILQFSTLSASPNASLAFICLPTAYQDPFDVGTNLVAIGWGVTYQGSSTVSNYLQQVTVQAYSSTSADCVQGGIINSTLQFCAGVNGGGKDTCQGDSGGPLMAFVDNRWVLAGLTSSGDGCAQAGYPGLYTRVSTFVPYIRSIVNASVLAITTDLGATTVSTVTTTSQQNGGGSGFKYQSESLMSKLLSMLMFCFSISFFFLLSH